jgi:general secretion pathway protein D
LGVRWLAANPRGEDHGFAAVNESADSLLGGVASVIAGESLVPAIPPGMSVGYLHFDGEFVKAFIEFNASEGDTDFNVLSAPHVLTLDNERAIINISDNVPFITSRLTDDTGGTTLAQSETFEYRDVGIILEITPHISPDRMVRLEIVQKVNDVSVVPTGISQGALSERKREAETTVMVQDRGTLVLGGLMKDTDEVTISKVPFLGDIPILGWAFKSKSITKGKKNLLIFITPSIITDVNEATRITQEKTTESGEEIGRRVNEVPAMHHSDSFEGIKEPVHQAFDPAMKSSGDSAGVKEPLKQAAD